MSYGRDRTLVPVNIPNGTALSGEVNVGPLRIVGIIMPAAWTAGALTFKAVATQTNLYATPTYAEVMDIAGAAMTVATPAAATYIALADTVALVALGRLIVRSGTSGVPVNQAAARDFFLVCV